MEVRFRASFADEVYKKAKARSMFYDYSCQIRRYQIFLDEITPDQLSPSFLQDYMSLPLSFYDYPNNARQKYNSFLQRWATLF